MAATGGRRGAGFLALSDLQSNVNNAIQNIRSLIQIFFTLASEDGKELTPDESAPDVVDDNVALALSI